MTIVFDLFISIYFFDHLAIEIFEGTVIDKLLKSKISLWYALHIFIERFPPLKYFAELLIVVVLH